MLGLPIGGSIDVGVEAVQDTLKRSLALVTTVPQPFVTRTLYVPTGALFQIK